MYKLLVLRGQVVISLNDFAIASRYEHQLKNVFESRMFSTQRAVESWIQHLKRTAIWEQLEDLRPNPYERDNLRWEKLAYENPYSDFSSPQFQYESDPETFRFSIAQNQSLASFSTATWSDNDPWTPWIIQ